MSIFFKNFGPYIASYGPQIDHSHGENRLSHIIMWNKVLRYAVQYTLARITKMFLNTLGLDSQ